MDISLQKKVYFFKKISSKFNLHEAYKICILQVYAGLKNAASFDALPKTNYSVVKKIILFLNCLKIYSEALELDKNIKIFFQIIKKLFWTCILYIEMYLIKKPQNMKKNMRNCWDIHLAAYLNMRGIHKKNMRICLAIRYAL